MNIIQCCADKRLFRPYFKDDYATFASWRYVMRAANGIPLGPKGKKFIHEVTGRDPEKLNPEGYSQVLCLTGRRSGKSAGLAAVEAAHSAVFADTSRMRPGEIGMVACLSPTKGQSKLVKSYIEGIFQSSPVLRNEIVRSSQSLIELRSGIHIGILTGDWRTVRGYTLLTAIVDEVVFFNGGGGEEVKVRSDTELIAALRPGLATTGGKLIAISSVHAKRGWAYKQFQDHHGREGEPTDDTLVVLASSAKMNPTINQKIVENALRDDYSKARAEYFSEWRDDVGLFIPREVLEGLVAKGVTENLPRRDEKYYAFVDMSGGRGDDAALAIAHREDEKILVDYIGRWKAPFDPEHVTAEIVTDLKRYGLRHTTGDNYAASHVSAAFGRRGIRYIKSEKNKSELYLELLPKLQSSQIQLLDHEPTIAQLSALERRTRSGGRDIVDHPSGGHDDLANVIAGVAQLAVSRRIRVGSFPLEDDSRSPSGFNY